jgi:ATP-dependent Zn protease
MPEKQRKTPWLFILFYVGIGVWILYTSVASQQPVPQHVSYSEFLTAIQDGKVESVRVTSSELVGTMK